MWRWSTRAGLRSWPHGHGGSVKRPNMDQAVEHANKIRAYSAAAKWGASLFSYYITSVWFIRDFALTPENRNTAYVLRRHDIKQGMGIVLMYTMCTEADRMQVPISIKLEESWLSCPSPHVLTIPSWFMNMTFAFQVCHHAIKHQHPVASTSFSHIFFF
jgi:hypothetical protein